MYKLLKDYTGGVSDKTVMRLPDNSIIPFDEANTDYQQYLAWLAEGNEPLPADEVNE